MQLDALCVTLGYLYSIETPHKSMISDNLSGYDIVYDERFARYEFW